MADEGVSMESKEETALDPPAQDEQQQQSDVPTPNLDWGEDISPNKNGGLFKKILTPGSDPLLRPGPGDEVFVHYSGQLLSGEVFDSSIDRGELFNFKLNENKVIKGWDIGVATMCKGEKCLLTCTPDFAYGESGSPPKIPANATLQFEVELFEWKGEDVTGDGGVVKNITKAGDGYSKPEDGAMVEAHIRGLCDGAVFQEGDFSFEFGEGTEKGLLASIEKGIGTMKRLECAKFTIKPDYGYGAEGNTVLGIPGNATLIYEIRLNNFTKIKQAWEYDSIAERTANAGHLKERGTKYFKLGKYQLACGLYNRGAELYDNIDDLDDSAKVMQVALHLNQAACHLKLSEPSLAIKECEEVLKVDDRNIKAYFRRGQARQLLQDYNEAIEDFKEVLKIEPTNKAAQKEIIQTRNKLKAYHDKEKKKYAKMFEMLADHTQQEPESSESPKAEPPKEEEGPSPTAEPPKEEEEGPSPKAEPPKEEEEGPSPTAEPPKEEEGLSLKAEPLKEEGGQDKVERKDETTESMES